MRKTLIPLVACLALCGAATTALVMSSAHAQPAPHKPMMVAQADTTPPPPPGPQDRMGPPRRGFDRPAPSPADIAARMKQMCEDTVARENGRLAYLETSLNLTASEQPLFQRWRTAVLGVARKRADDCNQHVSQRQTARAARQQDQNNQASRGANRTSITDRMAHEEDRLKQRLANVQAERPALEAFYNALSPTQKTEMARAEERDHRGHDRMRDAMRGPMHGPRFASAMGPGGMGRGPMGPRGPMGQGPMGQGPMGGPPMQPQTR